MTDQSATNDPNAEQLSPEQLNQQPEQQEQSPELMQQQAQDNIDHDQQDYGEED